MESFVVRDKEEALLVNKFLTGKRTSKTLNREQLSSVFETVGDEKLYVMDLNGSIKEEKDGLLLSDQDLLHKCNSNFSSQLDDYINALHFNYFSEATLSFFKRKIEDMKIEDVPQNLSVLPNNLLLVKINETDINMNIVSAKFLQPNSYIVDTVEVPADKYTLDEVKFLATKINDTKEPKISLRLNPGVEKEEIEKLRN